MMMTVADFQSNASGLVCRVSASLVFSAWSVIVVAAVAVLVVDVVAKKASQQSWAATAAVQPKAAPQHSPLHQPRLAARPGEEVLDAARPSATASRLQMPGAMAPYQHHFRQLQQARRLPRHHRPLPDEAGVAKQKGLAVVDQGSTCHQCWWRCATCLPLPPRRSIDGDLLLQPTICGWRWLLAAGGSGGQTVSAELWYGGVADFCPLLMLTG